MSKTSDAIDDFLNMPRSDWATAIEAARARGLDLQSVESELSRNIQAMVRLYGYVGHGYTSGCGEQPHADSVKAGDVMLAKVRTAMFTLA